MNDIGPGQFFDKDISYTVRRKLPVLAFKLLHGGDCRSLLIQLVKLLTTESHQILKSVRN